MKAETLGARLQRLRIEAGLTQTQLAERADVPLTTLRNWEYDRREPLATTLFKLAQALGVDCRAFTDPPLRPATGRQPARPMGRPRRGDTNQASTSAEPGEMPAAQSKPRGRKMQKPRGG